MTYKKRFVRCFKGWSFYDINISFCKFQNRCAEQEQTMKRNNFSDFSHIVSVMVPIKFLIYSYFCYTHKLMYLLSDWFLSSPRERNTFMKFRLHYGSSQLLRPLAQLSQSLTDKYFQLNISIFTLYLCYIIAWTIYCNNCISNRTSVRRKLCFHK